MATLKEIRQRISSIKGIQQITKAMKMVAAAKLRRAQQRISAARPYAQKIDQFLRDLLVDIENFQNPLMQSRPVEKISLVVVSADRGLCGSFNSNIIKRTLKEIDDIQGAEVEIVPVGKKGYDFFRKRGYPLGKDFINFFNELEFIHAREIVKHLTREFLDGNTDQVKLIYNEFKTLIQQNLIVEDFLPIPIRESEQEVAQDYIYEPSQIELLNQLLPKHLNMQMWRVLLESFTAEQGARMTAMENATDNASELIHDLTLQYNKARQASITTELIEIVSGAEALRGA